jgi:hypothetical protein
MQDTMPSPETAAQVPEFYVATLDTLIASGVPFLVGGAYALARDTGIARDTKDLDVFVHPDDVERVLRLFSDAGYHTELTFPHWLGRPVKLSPPEEMIWSKAFIMERERYDGADVTHLLRARGRELDWARLLRRFGPHWRVLLSHLVLFGFVYPGERDAIPAGVMRALLGRLDVEGSRPAPDARVCAGTLLSRAQYLVDTESWGYDDARRAHGTMSEEDIAWWTAAIEGEPPRPADDAGAGPPEAGRDSRASAA